MNSISEKEQPIFSIKRFRIDIFHLPLFFAGAGAVGMLILVALTIPYWMTYRDFYEGLIFIPFIPFLLYFLFGMVIPGSKHRYFHIYKDGIDSEKGFAQGLKEFHSLHYFTPYELLKIYPKKILFVKCYFFADLKTGGVNMVAPDIAEKLFPYIKEQAGEERWNEIFKDKP